MSNGTLDDTELFLTNLHKANSMLMNVSIFLVDILFKACLFFKGDYGLGAPSLFFSLSIITLIASCFSANDAIDYLTDGDHYNSNKYDNATNKLNKISFYFMVVAIVMF